MVMTVDRPRTLGELAASGYRIESVKDEMRRNLIALLPSGKPLFPGILGYDETVVPQVQNAILSKHDILFLGLRGQAKTRMLRELVRLLDDAIPIVAGSEIHDNPFAPVSKHARDLIASQGDDTPIEWIGRDDRYHEKLATPDVTIADLIGEVDMIKHAEGRYLSSELTMHFGLIPAREPGNLLHQRAARSGAQDPGRVVQRARRARRPDPRLSGAAGPGPLHGVLGQPRRLHQPRADRHAAQGSDRVGHSHALSDSRARSAWRSATRTRGSTATTTASRKLLIPTFIKELVEEVARLARIVAAREPAVGGLGADVDRQPRERRLERRAAGDHPSRTMDRAPGLGPGIRRGQLTGQARADHDRGRRARRQADRSDHR